MPHRQNRPTSLPLPPRRPRYPYATMPMRNRPGRHLPPCPQMSRTTKTPITATHHHRTGHPSMPIRFHSGTGLRPLAGTHKQAQLLHSRPADRTRHPARRRHGTHTDTRQLRHIYCKTFITSNKSIHGHSALSLPGSATPARRNLSGDATS